MYTVTASACNTCSVIEKDLVAAQQHMTDTGHKMYNRKFISDNNIRYVSKMAAACYTSAIDIISENAKETKGERKVGRR